MIAASVLLLLAPLGRAEEKSQTMTVSARVVARAVLAIDQQPDQVVVTGADVARGYIDLEAPLSVRVKTNSRNGYLLTVSNASQAFAAVEMAFGESTMRVTEESWIARPYVAGGDAVNARLRVRLAPDTPPGQHPFSLQVSAQPL
jgi:hypothetical protein